MPVPLGVIAAQRTVVTAGFNPLSIPWHSAFWASDPGWTPPADGAAVSTWRNAGTSAAHATQATGANQPTYRAAFANLNNRPALQFVPTQGLVTTSPSIAQPNHVFAVGWPDPSRPADAAVIDGFVISSRHYLRVQGNGYVSMYAGIQVYISLNVTTSYAISALYNGASTAMRVNATPYSMGDSGAQSFANLVISAQSDGPSANTTHTGALAFIGVSDITLTAQQISDLETWAKTFYGVPIP